MAELKPGDLVSRLASEPLRPAYLIAGPEPLVVLECADAVRAAARAQGIGDREVYDIEGRDPDWDSVAAAFQAPGLFATRRVVEVRMPGGKPGKEGAEILSSFCADPPPDVVLLVTCAEWGKAYAGKWSEALARIGHQVTAWQVKPHELPGWIESRMRARGLKAQRDAVQALADRVEGNLLAAAQEIDKLALLAEGRTLDAAAMDAFVSDSARFDVFRLLDAAMNGQPAQVSRMLHGLRGLAVHRRVEQTEHVEARGVGDERFHRRGIERASFGEQRELVDLLRRREQVALDAFGEPLHRVAVGAQAARAQAAFDPFRQLVRLDRPGDELVPDLRQRLAPLAAVLLAPVGAGDEQDDVGRRIGRELREHLRAFLARLA